MATDTPTSELMIKLPPSPFIRRFGRLLSEVSLSGLIVDLGCNTGRNSRYLAELGHTVLGIDNRSAELQAAKALAQESGLRNCRFRLGDIRYPELGRRCAAVLINEVLHQLPKAESEALLETALDLTEPGGYHAVSDYMRVTDSDKGQENYLLPGELRAAYDRAGWETVTYTEAVTSQTYVDGRTLDNWQAAIIARRPTEG